MIPTKQEWRVKEKTSMPTITTSDDDMDLLDDDESLLIKDGSPPSTDMDINMVFKLPAEFKGFNEEIAQLVLHLIFLMDLIITHMVMVHKSGPVPRHFGVDPRSQRGVRPPAQAWFFC
jgi:hypothetical protein